MAVSRRYVALLRGVNVGRSKRVAMRDLRAVVASLGYAAPRTLLNSGNVVFRAPEASPVDIAVSLEDALSAQLAVSSRVTVLTADEFTSSVRGNPLLAAVGDPSRLIVGFLRDASDVDRLRALALRDWAPEAFAAGERVAYAWCPGGVSSSPLLAAVARAVGDSITARNWATVLKLQTLLDTGEGR